MKFFQILPLLQLAGIALATPAAAPAPVPAKKLVKEPANPPKQPANIPLYLIPEDSGSICENWHHTFKNGNKIGWCAGCKRLERCGVLLTVEAAACIAGIAVMGPGMFKVHCSVYSRY